MLRAGIRGIATNGRVEDGNELLKERSEELGVEIPQELGHGGESGKDVGPGVLVLELERVQIQLHHLVGGAHAHTLWVTMGTNTHDGSQTGVVGDEVYGQRLVKGGVGGGEAGQHGLGGGEEHGFAVVVLLLEVVTDELEGNDMVLCNVLFVVSDLCGDGLERLEGGVDGGVGDEARAVKDDLDGAKTAVIHEGAAMTAHLESTPMRMETFMRLENSDG